ncbi:MAG TPA: patatin-like phospholipase family protein, partial [Prevotella sp.]
MKGKKLLLAVLICMVGTLLSAQPAPRKKVAVVLSGGGAKGMAHIGALKVIERAGIPIDIITGTSMGSIVGGLYAVGYDATYLDSLVRKQNWKFLLSDRNNLQNESIEERQKQSTYFFSKDLHISRKKLKTAGGFIEGKNIGALFAKLTADYADSIDFNKLPIPFACVATDIVTNTEYDYHSGVLAEAMRASMSIPGAFSPIRKGDMVLVDGGLRNNFPVDIARRMGADVVIGVTVQGEPRTADDLEGGASVLGQIVDVNCKNKYEENMAHTDVLIRANTKGYSAASFTTTAIDTLIQRGENEAMKHWDKLMELKQQLGFDHDFRPARPQRPTYKPAAGKVKLRGVSFVNVTTFDENRLRKKYHLNTSDSLSTEEVEKIIASMRVNFFYSDADYTFIPNEDGYDVIVTAKEKRQSKIGLGVRFDTEEMVALQVNADFLLNTHMPMKTDV